MTAHRAQVRDVKDTLGVCISGGGLRSASFGMGALQALSVAGTAPSHPESHVAAWRLRVVAHDGVAGAVRHLTLPGML
jgi:hypothetical protein